MRHDDWACAYRRSMTEVSSVPALSSTLCDPYPKMWHLPLRIWFMATALITNAKKGLSAKQVERDLDVSYKTAWYLCHRLRETMRSEQSVFDGNVEMAETYIGGKWDPRNTRPKYDRQAVMGVVQRGTENMPSQVQALLVPNRNKEVSSRKGSRIA
jgi:hypothetical protein